MGMDLYGVGKQFHFNNVGWRLVLEMALDHAWRPAGTEYNPWEWCRAKGLDQDNLTPDDAALVAKQKAEWDGGYTSNDFQIVTASDAAALADALEVALRTFPMTVSH